MRLELPPGLGDQWRGLFLATADGKNWINRQPSLLDVMYGGIADNYMVTVASTTGSASYFGFVSINEDPVPARLNSIDIWQVADATGALVTDYATQPSTSFRVNEAGVNTLNTERARANGATVLPDGPSSFTGIEFNLTRVISNGELAPGDGGGYPSVVFDVPDAADPGVMRPSRFHFVAAGYYMVSVDVSWMFSAP